MEPTLKYKIVSEEDIYQSKYKRGIPFDECEKIEMIKLINLLFPSFNVEIKKVPGTPDTEFSLMEFCIVYKHTSKPYLNYHPYSERACPGDITIFKMEDDYYGVVVNGNKYKYFIADQFDGILELINDLKI